MHIAILDDDPEVRHLVTDLLVAQGHVCSSYHTGEAFLQDFPIQSFDLAIVDWMLPDTSGISAMQRMREQVPSAPPVLMLTSRNAEENVVEALMSGADDYMSKPVREEELKARVAVFARRLNGQEHVQHRQWGRYRFDHRERRVAFDGVEVKLARKEYDLAWFLFMNQGRAVSRQLLVDAHLVTEDGPFSRSLDTHMHRIKAKLSIRPEHGFQLRTIYGYGYRLEAVTPPMPDRP